MQNVKERLLQEFQSSSTKTVEFNDFFKLFKKEFNKELKQLNAQDIKYSKGHFDIGVFFRVGEQWYNAMLGGDVRGRVTQIVVRTAKHQKDYQGGGNHWFNIETDMYQRIAKDFGID